VLGIDVCIAVFEKSCPLIFWIRYTGRTSPQQGVILGIAYLAFAVSARSDDSIEVSAVLLGIDVCIVILYVAILFCYAGGDSRIGVCGFFGIATVDLASSELVRNDIVLMQSV